MRLKKIIVMIGLIILAIISVIFVGVTSYRKAQIEKVKNQTRINSNDGVYDSFHVEVNGVKQWLLARGHNKENPLLLFLHGGPGKPESSFKHLFQNELEKHVTIVHWDQRGAGKSYDGEFDYKNDLSKDVLVNDAKKIVRFLTEKYHKKKIYLLGHSWGSYLAMRVAYESPEIVAGVIGMGQVVDFESGFEASYNKMKEMVGSLSSSSEALSQLGPPPYDLKKLKIFTKLIYQYGGELASQDGYAEIIKQSYYSPDYNFVDHLNWVKGQMKSMEVMLPQLREINLMSEIPEIEVPVVFFAGKYDLNTPSNLVVDYLNVLKAPYKNIVWFENSAHSPNLEEPKLFQSEVTLFIASHPVQHDARQPTQNSN